MDMDDELNTSVGGIQMPSPSKIVRRKPMEKMHPTRCKSDTLLQKHKKNQSRSFNNILTYTQKRAFEEDIGTTIIGSVQN